MDSHLVLHSQWLSIPPYELLRTRSDPGTTPRDQFWGPDINFGHGIVVVASLGRWHHAGITVVRRHTMLCMAANWTFTKPTTAITNIDNWHRSMSIDAQLRACAGPSVESSCSHAGHPRVLNQVVLAAFWLE
jgi:hypothetical protein